MVIMELREAAQEKAFELLDELHELSHQKKMVMCELEDTLYDCFEDSKDAEPKEESEEGTDLGFKSGYNRHYAMRNFDKADDDDMKMRAYRRRMQMRRRMRRYA